MLFTSCKKEVATIQTSTAGLTVNSKDYTFSGGVINYSPRQYLQQAGQPTIVTDASYGTMFTNNDFEIIMVFYKPYCDICTSFLDEKKYESLNLNPFDNSKLLRFTFKNKITDKTYYPIYGSSITITSNTTISGNKGGYVSGYMNSRFVCQTATDTIKVAGSFQDYLIK